MFPLNKKTPEFLNFLNQNPILAKKYTHTIEIKSKQTILLDTKTEIGFIKNGLIDLQISVNNVWKSTLILSDQDFLYLDSFSDSYDYSFHNIWKAKTITKTKLVIVDKEYFLNHLYVNPQLFYSILTKLSTRYQFSLQKSLSSDDAHKIAYFLIENIKLLATKFSNNNIVFDKYINIKRISAYTHVTNKHVKDVLQNWEKENIIAKTNPITIYNIEKLVSIFND